MESLRSIQRSHVPKIGFFSWVLLGSWFCRGLMWPCSELIASQSAKNVARIGRLSSAAVQKSSHALAEDTARLLSLRLVPETLSLSGASASQRVLALGKFSDGIERDVTSKSHFSLSNPAIAKVEQNERVIALAEGKGLLKAEIDGKTAKADIRIQNLREHRPF